MAANTITLNGVDQYSLYANGFVITDTNGNNILLRNRLTYPASNTDTFLVLRHGETLPAFAYRAYISTLTADAAQKSWHVIAEANSIFDPFDLSAYYGTYLRIPKLQ